MDNEVAATRVKKLDPEAVMIALDAWHLDKRRTYASTPRSSMEAAISAYLSAIDPAAGGYSILSTDKTRMGKLQEALRPFAACVFNDNGDMTVSVTAKREDYIAAYFALRALQNVSTIP